MELTVGTTLQGNKYVVQEILNQDEQGITCKVVHTYLDQTVFLQTFNPALQQQEDFVPLKQRFVAGVRSIVKQTAHPAFQVLDYFEENGLPFVVLQAPLSAIPKLSDWLTESVSSTVAAPTAPMPEFLTEPSFNASSASSNSPSSSSSVFNASPSLASSVAVVPMAEANATINVNSGNVNSGNANSGNANSGVGDRAIANASVPGLDLSDQPSTRGSTYEPIIFHPDPRASVPVTSRAPDALMPARATLARSPQKKFKSKFPVVLMVIAVTSGLVGVGTGLALRFTPTAQKTGPQPRLSFFQRQQSFPAAGNWPIQERAIYTLPETIIEQPLYRAAPPTDYNAPVVPPGSIESIPYQDPAIEELTPPPDYTETPEDLEVPALKMEPKQPLELAPLPEFNPDVPEYTLPPETSEPPPLITDPPAPIPLPDSNSVHPSSKPLLGNSSRIVTQ